MKNQRGIMEEIKAIGLRVEVNDPGFVVYPRKKRDYVIYTAKLVKLIAIAQKYNLRHYINFKEEYIRLH